MRDINDPSFQKCLSLLSSNVDEEKFVGIILVKNLIQPDDYVCLNEVYNALGLDFLYRLLQTPSTKGEESISYINLSVSILSTFSTLETPPSPDNNSNSLENSILYKISQNPLIKEIVPLVLQRFIESEPKNINLQHESIVFLYSLASIDSQLSKEIKSSTTTSPLNIFEKKENLKILAKIVLRLHSQCNTIMKKQDNSNNKQDNNNKQDINNKLTEDENRLLNTLELSINLILIITWKVQQKNQPSITKNTLVLLEPLSIVFRERIDELKFSLLSIFISIFQFEELVSLFFANENNNSNFDNSTNNNNNNNNNNIDKRNKSKNNRINAISNDDINDDDLQDEEEFNHHQQEELYREREHFEKSSQIWKDNLRVGLYSIFSSKKLKESHRDKSIILYSLLFDIFGGKWVIGNIGNNNNYDSTKNNTLYKEMSEKFLILSLQMARTEIHMILLQTVENKINEGKQKLLSSCYLIIENTICFLTSYFEETSTTNTSNSLFSVDSLGKIRNVLVESISIIIDYLKQVSVENYEEPPTLHSVSSLKVMGLWISEETDSMRDTLNLSIHSILDYFLHHKSTHGFYICFLVPGLSFYLDDPHYRKEFFKQQGHIHIAKFLTYYLDVFVQYSKDQDIRDVPIINDLRSFGITGDTIVNVILPRTTEILTYFLNDPEMDISTNSSYNGNSKSVFISLFTTISQAIVSLTSELNQSLWDTYVTYQYILSNLISLSFGILKHFDEKVITSTPSITQDSLSRLFDNCIMLYTSIEFPPHDMSSVSLWNVIKIYWLSGLELMIQCIDKYPLLSNCLSNKRWPPPDFRVPISTPSLDNQTVVEVNRNIGTLIRKMIGLKSSSSNNNNNNNNNANPPQQQSLNPVRNS
eukprot:gene3721-4634_t